MSTQEINDFYQQQGDAARAVREATERANNLARYDRAYPWQRVFNRRHYNECTLFFNELSNIGELSTDNIHQFTSNYGLFNYYRLTVAPPDHLEPNWSLTRDEFNLIYNAA